MEGLSGPLALKFLSEERDALNARAARARVSCSGFDAVEFSDAFARIVSGLLSLLERGAEYVVARDLLAAIFDACADFAERGVFKGLHEEGSDAEGLADGIAGLFVHRIDILVAEPATTPGTLMNAYLKLRREDRGRADRWRDAISGLPSVKDTGALLRCGILAAWLCGFGAYGDAALASLARMDRGQAEAIMGLPAGALAERDMATFAKDLGERPWAMPASIVRGSVDERVVMEKVGAFKGLGGAFIAPPLVSKSGNDFIVTDGRRVFTLKPDRFGSRIAGYEEDGAPSPGEARSMARKDCGSAWAVEATGPGLRIKSRGLRVDIEGEYPIAVSSIAFDSDTLCITSPYSHAILVAGRALA